MYWKGVLNMVEKTLAEKKAEAENPSTEKVSVQEVVVDLNLINNKLNYLINLLEGKN